MPKKDAAAAKGKTKGKEKAEKGDKSKSKDKGKDKAKGGKADKPASAGAGAGAAASNDPALLPFEAGSIFSKYDLDGDGKLDKHEFTELIKKHPNLLGTPANTSNHLPAEVISNRILTHYDETAGVALPSHEIEQHRNVGGKIVPLVDAYKTRYENLRMLLTGKLLPKREHLLQLRRQLQNTSVEVDATRRAIERETLTDTEQVLERLRGVESMRQSAVKHQILHIEEELQIIERVVKRVEQANLDESSINHTTNVLLTSAHPSSIPVESLRPPRALYMVELIHQYSDLCARISSLSDKPVTVQVDFPTDDFPKETAERLEVISRCDKYMHALTVKDHMLWQALKDKEQAEELLSEERKLSYEYAQEVGNWAEVSQKLTKELLAQRDENERLARDNRDLMDIMREHNLYYASKI